MREKERCGLKNREKMRMISKERETVCSKKKRESISRIIATFTLEKSLLNGKKT